MLEMYVKALLLPNKEPKNQNSFILWTQKCCSFLLNGWGRWKHRALFRAPVWGPVLKDQFGISCFPRTWSDQTKCQDQIDRTPFCCGCGGKNFRKYFLVFSITHQIGQRRLLYSFKGKVRNNIPQKNPHPVLHLKDRDYIVLDLCSYCLRGSQSALVAPHQTGFVFLLEVFALFRGSSLKLVQGFWGSRPGLSWARSHYLSLM